MTETYIFFPRLDLSVDRRYRPRPSTGRPPAPWCRESTIPMTFCCALKCRDGIVALADTQIVRGSEQVNKSKLAILHDRGESFFIMTSGLRSVRDKLMIYAEEAIAGSDVGCERLYQAANLFGTQMQRIREEDGSSLKAANLPFNAHAIIGGWLAGDSEPSLFYLYPEGNWIEVDVDSPWFMIGRSSYGKPILDRQMRVDVSLERATALALLAFDATQTSVTDVDYPIDMLTLASADRETRQARFSRETLAPATDDWHTRLAEALDALPMDWADSLVAPGGRRPD